MAVWNSYQAGTRITDPVLTQISVGWQSEDFVGEALFPPVSVTEKSAKYYVFNDRHSHVTPETDYRAPGTQANEIAGLTLSSDMYYTQEHSLQIPVTDEERENVPAGSGINPEIDAVELLTKKLWTARELAMKALVTNPSNYATNHAVALNDATETWDNYSSAASDPAQVIEKAKRRISRAGAPPLNTAVIPEHVMSFLRWHPKLLAKVQYVSGSNLSEGDVISLLGMDGWRIVIPRVQYNTAAIGQSPSTNYIWGDSVILAHVPPAAGMKVPAFAYEFRRFPLSITRWREEQRRSNLIRCQWEYDLKLIGVDNSGKSITGYLITNTVSAAGEAAL
jgi:hypothetical protein